MPTFVVSLRRLAALFLGLLMMAPPLAFAALTPVETVQIQATRATGSLLLLRGEGFQKDHQLRLEDDIQALQRAMQALQSDETLYRLHLQLIEELRRGVAFGPGEDSMPWRYPEELARALRDFLSALRTHPSASPTEVAAKVEYLAVQYLSRAYFGNFEIAREQPDTYLGQDERKLVPFIDQEMQGLAEDNPKLTKIQARWQYLRVALLDMNSQSSALVSASGRPFAPTTVDRHARALSEEWMALE
ncbi:MULTISPECIES: hypothetical protein [Pseudomonas]|jgi:hypothetical protein|uniref:Uncharacterized protein n=1 Tax=Serpens gallinarum TaxID=2763075 RepID=A0ABR8TM97_9PSED|nr:MULTISPECIES: hypothetical protein [Pseudomonas]MBD7976878.1 hypothetical protein [Serpens gallinarum]MBF0676700.1 hypothetical protein [Pseudomonas sp.]